MNFAMLYSCGKDSALALYRMINEGHTPVCLIVTYNKDADRSWFHGITVDLLEAVSKSLAIPVVTCVCTGETYQQEVERCLKEARTNGAEAAVFGDIDIEDHRAWNLGRCESAGLECLLPLWQESREALVAESIDAGFKSLIKCVDLSRLDTSFLGETLSKPVIDHITATGSDACGENGEYHTFVYDGPLFKTPIPMRTGEKIVLGSHAVLDLSLDKQS